MQIKRDDAIYLEIEQFEDYELTNNIAFEMAIRNETVIGDILAYIDRDEIDYIQKHGFKYPFEKLHLNEYMILSKDQRDQLKAYSEKRKTPLSYSFSNVRRISLSEKEREPIDDINEDYKSVVRGKVDFVSNVLVHRTYNFQLKASATDKEIEEFLDNAYFRDEYLDATVFRDAMRKINDETRIKESVQLHCYSDQYPHLFEHIFTGVDEESVKVAKIYAHINTSRPEMIIERTAKIINTSFNMALELTELIAQISLIKKEFDENSSNIKSVAEYFNVELEKADRLICNSNGKCIDPRGYLTKQQKMADMFFIYDCLKAGINKTAIKHQIYEYHLKNEVEKPLDDKTLYKYRDIAIKYIDHFGYKELLTGVKSI